MKNCDLSILLIVLIVFASITICFAVRKITEENKIAFKEGYIQKQKIGTYGWIWTK